MWHTDRYPIRWHSSADWCAPIPVGTVFTSGEDDRALGQVEAPGGQATARIPARLGPELGQRTRPPESQAHSPRATVHKFQGDGGQKKIINLFHKE